MANSPPTSASNAITVENQSSESKPFTNVYRSDGINVVLFVLVRLIQILQLVYVMSDSPVQPSPEKLSQTQQALCTLRTRIVRGEFEPGQRLPSFGQLESQLGVGRTVLQQAITMLKDDGFVTSLPRQGLYIAQSPPHLGRYAIVFPCFPDHRQWSGFHGATIAEARRMADEKSQIKFEYYQGVNDERRGGVVLDSLLTEVTAQRLAGLILLPETHDLAAHPDVLASGVPMLMIDGERDQLVILV